MSTHRALRVTTLPRNNVVGIAGGLMGTRCVALRVRARPLPRPFEPFPAQPNGMRGAFSDRPPTLSDLLPLIQPFRRRLAAPLCIGASCVVAYTQEISP